MKRVHTNQFVDLEARVEDRENDESDENDESGTTPTFVEWEIVQFMLALQMISWRMGQLITTTYPGKNT